MFDGCSVDAGTLRDHATEVAALRTRLTEVADIYADLRWDDETFGPSCGWVATPLARLSARQTELIDEVATNFERIAEDLVRAADASTPGTSAPTDGRSAARRLPQRATDRFTDLHARITDGDWIEPDLTELPAAEPHPPAEPPEWAASRVARLQGMIEGLTGRPDLVAEQVTAVRGTAADLHATCLDLQHALRGVAEWPAADVDEYLDLMGNNVEALAGLVGTSTAIALSAAAADRLVTAVHAHADALVTELVAGLPPEPTNPAEVVAALEACHRAILRCVCALVSSLTELAELLDG